MRATLSQLRNICVTHIKSCLANIKRDVCNCQKLPSDLVYERHIVELRDDMVNRMNIMFEEKNEKLCKSIDALSKTLTDIKRHG